MRLVKLVSIKKKKKKKKHLIIIKQIAWEIQNWH